jgi:aerobic-type carbon monoxide dehydrogenase small subunit (CoxS/CutS family)
MSGPLVLKVNGETRTVPDVPDSERLLDLLRWGLGLRGTKEGCRTGDCGACTVLVEGVSTLSCLTLAREVEGSEITTIEGLTSSPEAHQLQSAFAEAGAVQCGYCTPGFVLALTGLLREHPGEPLSAELLRSELGGNLCRCTGYFAILEAISRRLGEGASPSVPRSEFRVEKLPP